VNKLWHKKRHILTVLALALMFASVHFVLHEADQSIVDLTVQDDCQICRVNHIPVLPGTGIVIPDVDSVVAYSLPTTLVRSQHSLRFPPLGARAPPLS